MNRGPKFVEFIVLFADIIVVLASVEIVDINFGKSGGGELFVNPELCRLEKLGEGGW